MKSLAFVEDFLDHLHILSQAERETIVDHQSTSPFSTTLENQSAWQEPERRIGDQVETPVRRLQSSYVSTYRSSACNVCALEISIDHIYIWRGYGMSTIQYLEIENVSEGGAVDADLFDDLRRETTELANHSRMNEQAEGFVGEGSCVLPPPPPPTICASCQGNLGVHR